LKKNYILSVVAIQYRYNKDIFVVVTY